MIATRLVLEGLPFGRSVGHGTIIMKHAMIQGMLPIWRKANMINSMDTISKPNDPAPTRHALSKAVPP